MSAESSESGRLLRFPADAARDRSSSVGAGGEPTQILVAAARRGDPQAWSEIGARYRSALMLLMRRHIPSGARRRFDTDDVFQSAMLCAFREIDSYEYRGEGSFYSWLVRIFQNRIKSRLRAMVADKRDVRRDEAWTGIHDGLHARADDHTPELLAARAEDYADLVQAFSELDRDEQRLLAMYMVDGMKLVELGHELGVSPRTVQRRIALAFEHLSKKTSGRSPESGSSAFHPIAED